MWPSRNTSRPTTTSLPAITSSTPNSTELSDPVSRRASSLNQRVRSTSSFSTYVPNCFAGPSGGTKLAKKEPKPAAAKKEAKPKVEKKTPAVKKAISTKKAAAKPKRAAKAKTAAKPNKVVAKKEAKTKVAKKAAAPKAKKTAASKAVCHLTSSS